MYFPIEMHIVAAKVPRWSQKWCWLQALSAFTFCISLAAAIGSIAYVKEDLEVGRCPLAAALIATRTGARCSGTGLGKRTVTDAGACCVQTYSPFTSISSSIINAAGNNR